MISAARFQKLQQQINSTKSYSQKIQQLLFDLLKKTGKSHPFLEAGITNNEGLLVITSEKGLCGSYNTNIIKKTFEFIKSKPQTELDISVIGKKGREFFRRNGLKINHDYFDVFKNFSSNQAEIISDEITKLFFFNKLLRFNVIYAEYKSLFSQQIVIKQILPIEKVPVDELKYDYIYEPSKEIILDKLFSRYVKSEFFRILINAYTSEIAARRNSMENATKNASELIDGLSLYLNKLRQQQITKELTEIVNASEA